MWLLGVLEARHPLFTKKLQLSRPSSLLQDSANNLGMVNITIIKINTNKMPQPSHRTLSSMFPRLIMIWNRITPSISMELKTLSTSMMTVPILTTPPTSTTFINKS